MRLIHLVPALAAAAVMASAAGAAAAQDPAADPVTGGEYRAALTRMLTETTQGICPADVMADDLLAACEEQITQMAPALQSLGAVMSMTLVGVEGEGAERVERYEVAYAAGPTLVWFIGGRGADGRFSAAGAGG